MRPCCTNTDNPVPLHLPELLAVHVAHLKLLQVERQPGHFGPPALLPAPKAPEPVPGVADAEPAQRGGGLHAGIAKLEFFIPRKVKVFQILFI